MFKIIQNNNNNNKHVNENVTELPFLNHHITEFLCYGQHILLLRLWEKRLAHTLMIRIQNSTVSVGFPRGMWKHLVTLYMQISLDSIIIFLEPNPKSSWTKIQNDSFKGLYTVILLVQTKDRNKTECPLSGKCWINYSQNRILRNWKNAYRSTLCTDMKNYTKNRLLSDENKE